MKSIFKKIAFVLAVAMVVTMLPARAASVSAADASANKWVRKTCTLYIDAPVPGDKDGAYVSSAYATAKTKVKVAKDAADGWGTLGYSVSFKSDDETVASVGEKYGLVTAVGIGMTTITATFTKKGAATVTESFPVTVKRFAVDVALEEGAAKAVDELVVGAEVALKAVMTDADGNSEVVEKTAEDGGKLSELLGEGRQFVTDYLKYTVTNPEGKDVIKVEGNKLTAVAEGEATLTVKAYRYDWQSWGKTKSQYVKVVTAQKDIAVTVRTAGLLDAKQTKYDTVAITCETEALAAAIAKDISKISATYALGDNQIEAFIKSASVDSANNKLVYVTLYSDLIKDYTYTFKCGTSSVEVIGVDLTAIATIRITTAQACVNVDTPINVEFLDANGIVLPAGSNNLTIEATESNSDYYVYQGEGGYFIYFFAANKTANVKAAYDMGYDKDGNELKDIETTGVIVSKVATTENELTGYALGKTVANGEDVSKLTFSNGVLNAVKNEPKQLYAKYSVTNYNGQIVTKYTDSDDANEKEIDATFHYVSTNDSVLLVNKDTGLVEPVAAGTAQVIVYRVAADGNSEVVVGIIAIKVEGKRLLTSFNATINKTNITSQTTNDYGVWDPINLNVSAKDQLGDALLDIADDGVNGLRYSLSLVKDVEGVDVLYLDPHHQHTHSWGNKDEQYRVTSAGLDQSEMNDSEDEEGVVRCHHYWDGFDGFQLIARNSSTTAKSVQIKLTVQQQSGNWTSFSKVFTIYVRESGEATSYTLNSNYTSNFDLNIPAIASNGSSFTSALVLTGTDKNGYTTGEYAMTYSTSDPTAEYPYVFNVKRNGDDKQGIMTGNTFNAIQVVSGAAIKADLGTYIVTVKHYEDGKIRTIATKAITVTDSTVTPVAVVSDTKVGAGNATEANIQTALLAMLENGKLVISRNGSGLDRTKLEIVSVHARDVGDRVYVESIRVRETYTGGISCTFEYNVTIGKVFYEK